MPIVKLEVTLSNEDILAAVFLKSTLIATNGDGFVPLPSVDEIAHNLEKVTGNDKCQSLDKEIDDPEIDDFDFEDMLVQLFDYCLDHVKEYAGMPMDFEYCGVVLEFNEFINLLSNAQHTELSRYF
jgi:hypothetical protein